MTSKALNGTTPPGGWEIVRCKPTAPLSERALAVLDEVRRDWAAECTDPPREVCELALAHLNCDCVEAAYRRSDLFERRRIFMQQWADYVAATA